MSIVLYFIPILLCIVTPFCKELVDNRKWYIAVFIIFCLFYCFGYMTGSDWRSYEFWYDNLDFNKFYYGYKNEPGYYLYMMVFKKLGVGFWTYFVITKILLFAIVFKSLFSISKECGWLSMAYFLPWFGMYLFIDNPMRNAIAVGLFLLSVKYILSREVWKFLLVILLATSFHATAIFAIPMYWLGVKDISRKIYIILFLAINILFINREILFNVIVLLFGFVPYFSEKVITYFLLDSVYVQGSVFSFGMLWHMALFVLMMVYKDTIIEKIGNRYGVLCYNFAIIYLMLVRCALSVPVFMRIQLYYSVFFCICVALLAFSFDWRSRVMYVAVIFLVASYTCYDRTTGSARYVPYTNLVQNVFKDTNPSFSYRFYYNIKHSPYVKEIDIPQ